MKNKMWMKKGMLFSLAAVCFILGTGAIRAEAGWVTPSLRKKALESRVAAENEENGTKVSAAEEELKKKEEELRQLQNTKYDYLVKCTYCGGSRKSDTPCKKCGGSGLADIPGNLSLVVPCGYCEGGYERCSMCMGGKMQNPDYFALCKARDEKIKKLEEEIAELRGQLGLEIVGPVNPEPTYSPEPTRPDPNPPIWESSSFDCPRCRNKGWVDCGLCEGGYRDKIISVPDYSGSGHSTKVVKVKCTACKNGTISCSLCGGGANR